MDKMPCDYFAFQQMEVQMLSYKNFPGTMKTMSVSSNNNNKKDDLES